MRRWCLCLGWALWAVIVLLAALAHIFGQHFWPVGMLVYAPPQMWLIFLALLAISAWRWQHHLSWLCICTALFFAGPLWEWRTHRPSGAVSATNSPGTLRVITANRGDHHGHAITDFVDKLRPDLIAMQDSIYAKAWVPGAPEYRHLPHQSRVGEFLLLSRFPITRTELLATVLSPGHQPHRTLYKAARFEIDFNGRGVAVYNLHLPSPRQNMRLLGRKPSLASVQLMRQYWLDHATLIRDLLTRIESERMPCVVLGDWNQPTVGPLYRQLTRHLQDTHSVAGLGYGWTFPGDWWTVFTDGQAWMRLDLVLCSKEWRVLRSEVEPESESQHCAVGAVLKLQ
jgi:endonuclease/exonuclease/phosphatase family metal-dependent hydrolase